jgi:AbrB family looped-hinge helix DNA binding protein
MLYRKYELQFILASMKMTERGQITIPKAIRDQCGFGPHAEVEVKVRDGVVIVEPVRDMEQFDAAVDKWRGSGAARLESMGFKTSDDFIEALRGR